MDLKDTREKRLALNERLMVTLQLARAIEYQHSTLFIVASRRTVWVSMPRRGAPGSCAKSKLHGNGNRTPPTLRPIGRCLFVWVVAVGIVLDGSSLSGFQQANTHASSREGWSRNTTALRIEPFVGFVASHDGYAILWWATNTIICDHSCKP